MNGAKRLVISSNIQILKALSEHLSTLGYEILRQLPMITTTSIKDIIQLKPDCIILSEGAQYDDDLTLLKTIQTIKSQHKSRIIVHTITRRVGDGLLSDLITLNVYDFIPLSSFDVNELLTLLDNPREYSDVSNYHNYAKESATLDLPLELPPEISLAKPTDNPEPLPTKLTDDIIQLKNRIFGTTTISVASLQHGSGATHTALAIAEFLSVRGFKVAIVELKQKNDYGLIYLPRKESYSQTSFKYKKFDIYANDGETLPDDLMIEAMVGNYNYIVKDVGLIFKYDYEKAILDKPSTEIKKYEKGIFYNDLMKSDVKLVNTFGSKQYADSLEYLMTYLYIWKITDMKLLFNHTTEKTLKSYTKCSDSTMYITPYNPDDSINEEQDSFYSSLLADIIPRENDGKGTVIRNSIKKCGSFINTLISTGASKIPTLIRRKSKQ